MSLRAKLIAFFFLLAVAPLVAIGVVGYWQSTRALRALLEGQTADVAARVAAELSDRYALRQSDLLFLAENAETRRLFQARSAGDAAGAAAALAAADPFLRMAWAPMSHAYEEVEFRDGQGALVYRLAPSASLPQGVVPRALTLTQAIPGASEGHRAGQVVAVLRRDVALPAEVLESRFGRAGYTMVLDRHTGEILYHPRDALRRQTSAALLGPQGWDVDTTQFEQEHGTLRYSERDSARVAAFVSLNEPPWTVLSSAAEDEFAAPFMRTGSILLVLVLIVTAVAAIAFVLLTRRATRSLEALTAAADEVGTGNFAPPLPAAGHDELGRLSAAFGLMAGKVHDMLREIEIKRHMAAVGEFAAQVSHEIRNPLTSIKLNLQRLGRQSVEGTLPEATRVPLSISLREIERLERVLRGVLTIGRDPGERRPCGVHSVVTDALAVVRAQLEDQHVTVETLFEAENDCILAESEHLKAVFLNLFLNAAAAMPAGGQLQIRTEPQEIAADASRIRVHVVDTGRGIPVDLREKIFKPFYSTKPGGTGFGLPLALRTVEEHGGRIALLENCEADRGAEFVVDLPLAARESTS